MYPTFSRRPAGALASPAPRRLQRAVLAAFRRYTLLLSALAGAYVAGAACSVSSRGVEPQTPGEAVTVQGTVTRFERLPRPDQHLKQNAVVTINASGKPIRVELAPGWFLDERGLHFSSEQTIVVSGHAVEDDGESRVVAREVTQGTRVIRLRTEDGRPVWDDPIEKSSQPGDDADEAETKQRGTP